jgi:hypothetical protein
LSEAISRGYVEQVPVIRKPNRLSLKRERYRDTETAEICCLIEPDGKIREGDKVYPQDIVEPGEPITITRKTVA